MKNFLFEIKYFFQEFKFLKVYNSPFKPFLPKLYIGKIKIGTPYFYPRVFKRMTDKEKYSHAVKEHNRLEKIITQNPELNYEHPSVESIYKGLKHRTVAVPKKIGFDFVGLGYKIKWSDTDYRHEWNPVWSFVFLKWQIALLFVPPHDMNYWECWLIYTNHTNRNDSIQNRIKQAKKLFPCVWVKNNDVKINYWNLILKKKYL